jgi:uncharacterized metal-binding protein YceD (DUF177 family)
MNGVLHHAIIAADPPTDSIAIAASAEERSELAAEYGLQLVKGLTASVDVTPVSGGVDVSGRVVADVVQTCVVSLVPVEEHIDETFSVRYLREPQRVPEAGEEVVLDAEMSDPPELLEGPTVDVGALVEEHFALALNPYPRAPGAALPSDSAGSPSERGTSPFAVLAKLADTPKKKR